MAELRTEIGALQAGGGAGDGEPLGLAAALNEAVQRTSRTLRCDTGHQPSTGISVEEKVLEKEPLQALCHALQGLPSSPLVETRPLVPSDWGIQLLMDELHECTRVAPQCPAGLGLTYSIGCAAVQRVLRVVRTAFDTHMRCARSAASVSAATEMKDPQPKESQWSERETAVEGTHSLTS